LGRPQNFLRNALVGSGFDLIQHRAGSLDAVFGLILVLIILGEGGNGETRDYTQKQQFFHFFLTFWT
jgi:hypothetical protein